jgi:SSS family solute:Na+ symporter
LAPGIAAAFLLGILSKRITPKAGMWGLIIGFVVGVTRLSAKVFYSNDPTTTSNWFKSLFYDTNWLFFCGGMLVFCMIAIIVISMFTKPAPAEQIKGLTFSSSTPEQRAATRASWSAWDVIHSCIIVAITIAFYVYFW